jgi:nucleotide-binding universal stress UspA family protein
VHMPTLPARAGTGHKPVFGRILFPVDGSLSMTPLVHACLAFAAGIGAEVVAVHVVSPPHAALAMPGSPATAGAEPWQEIVRAALDHHADLICMGSHGRHGASEHIMASQAARVIEHSRLPVLLYR